MDINEVYKSLKTSDYWELKESNGKKFSLLFLEILSNPNMGLVQDLGAQRVLFLIKDCCNNKHKIEILKNPDKYGLKDVPDLLLEVAKVFDSDSIYEIYKNLDELGMENISTEARVTLLQRGPDKVTFDAFKNPEKYNIGGISLKQKIDLLCNCSNHAILHVLKNRKQFGIDKFVLEDLFKVIGTLDSKEQEKILLNPEKYGFNKDDLNNPGIVFFLSQDVLEKILKYPDVFNISFDEKETNYIIGGSLKIEKILSNPKKYGIEELKKQDVISIVKNEVDFLSEDLLKILIKKYNFSNDEIVGIIEEKDCDESVIQDVVTHRKKYGLEDLTDFQMASIIAKDSDLSRDVLENPEKYGFKNLSDKNKIKLISGIHSEKYKLQILENPETVGIDKSNINNIVEMVQQLYSADTNTLFKYLNKHIEDKQAINKLTEKLTKLGKKNSAIIQTFNPDLLLNDDIYNSFTEEQLLRITNYPEIQEFILKNGKNEYVNESINNILNNSENWVLSINRFINSFSKYNDLFINLQNEKEGEKSNEFVNNLLNITSSDANYFNIQNGRDVNNFNDIKNKLCLEMLNGDFSNLTPQLKEKKYSEEELYKFALLEYKYGISLEEAKNLVKRYGADTKELPKDELTDFLQSLKDIIEHKDIKNTIEIAIQNNTLSEPWNSNINIRDVEGLIINKFAELYNDVLYDPNKDDTKTSRKDKYVDKNGNETEIDVYTIESDFDMNYRVEGAYSGFEEPEDFKKYFQGVDISYHGNCESFIGNDSIAGARNINGVAVGYSKINKNGLIGAQPSDIGSTNFNKQFSAYNMPSEFRVPKQMKDNTRHTHNEMVKEKYSVDEEGNISKILPSYAVWIENDTIEERQQPGWQEQRDKNEQWIMTKKLAAQMGIPIVVIDREKFAIRETEKLEIMKKILAGEKVENEKYSKDIQEYCEMPKQDLIKEMITKFINNKIGNLFNEKISEKYFSNENLENMMTEITQNIDELKKTNPELADECSKVLNTTCQKELDQLVVERFANSEFSETLEIFRNTIKQNQNDLEEINQTDVIQDTDDTHKKRNLLQLYFDKKISKSSIGRMLNKVKDRIHGKEEDKSKEEETI